MTVTFTTGADTGPLDSGPGPVSTTTGPVSTTTGSTSTTTGSTSTTTGPVTTTDPTEGTGGATDAGSTDGGTTSGTTDGGTTDGGTTDGGTTGGDPTCQDAVECVIACGGPSPGCINMCDDGLSPGDAVDFQVLQGCIILGCIFNGSCVPGSFDDPACVMCRLDGQLDPSTVGCESEAMACT